MRQVDGGPDARARARESLAAVLSGVTETTRFTDAASLDAYDAVEAALAAGDNWQPAVRDGLRRAAERLSAQDGTDRLASQLQTVADALTPETEPLLGVAQALRARIEARAGVSAGQGAAPSKPGAVAGARTDRGGASAPRGGP
jgi:hypothetical protein